MHTSDWILDDADDGDEKQSSILWKYSRFVVEANTIFPFSRVIFTVLEL